VFEKSKVTGIRDGSPGTISANGYKIHAKHIVVATSVPTLPLVARGSYCFLEYPTESYIVAGKLKKPLDGMHISPDDGYYSILPIGPKSAPMVLVGGESHVAGATLRRQSRYKKLARFAEEKLGVTEITNKWSDRDYITYDGLPLVGKLYPWSKNLYVATAFRKWGLTGGTVAAMILHDLITRQHNNWAEAYDPQRVRPILHIPKVAAKYLLRKN
jgi:glycine/D-amino acid oxidase-like deaminating enzyme